MLIFHWLILVRIGKGKRDNFLEPVPYNYSWCLKFQIQNRVVSIINQTSELDFEADGSPRDRVPLDPNHPDSVITRLTEDNQIILGKKTNMLNLITLQPKTQKPNGPEATLQGVLRDRLGHHSLDTIAKVEKFFVNKNKIKNAINLKKYRLQVDFFLDADLTLHLGGDVTGDIKDTGNKREGAMDIFDVINQKCCVRGGRKVLIDSEYSLPKGEVKPVFEIYDSAGNHHPDREFLLNQPTDVKVRNLTIHLITPPQDIDFINQLRAEGLIIKLLIKRKDGHKSPKKFNFNYIPHIDTQCPYCDFRVDSDSMVEIAKGRSKARPGDPSRTINTGVKRARKSKPRPDHDLVLPDKKVRKLSNCSDSGLSSTMSASDVASPMSFLTQHSPSSVYSRQSTNMDESNSITSEEEMEEMKEVIGLSPRNNFEIQDCDELKLLSPHDVDVANCFQEPLVFQQHQDFTADINDDGTLNTPVEVFLTNPLINPMLGSSVHNIVPDCSKIKEEVDDEKKQVVEKMNKGTQTMSEKKEMDVMVNIQLMMVIMIVFMMLISLVMQFNTTFIKLVAVAVVVGVGAVMMIKQPATIQDSD